MRILRVRYGYSYERQGRVSASPTSYQDWGVLGGELNWDGGDLKGGPWIWGIACFNGDAWMVLLVDLACVAPPHIPGSPSP